MALVALAVLLALAPGIAEAHANLAESDPAPNSALTSAPEQVRIRFTEPLEPLFSHIEIFDSFGTRVDRDDSRVDRSNLLVMTVSLDPLPDGVYTVAWKNVSSVDGHRVRGAFFFSVGEPTSAVAVGDIPDEPLIQVWAEPVIRWLTLMGGLTLLGALLFRLTVLRPVIRSAPTGQKNDYSSLSFSDMTYLANTVVITVSWLTCTVGSLSQYVIQASLIYESSIVGTFFGPIWKLPIDTEWGRLNSARIWLLVVAYLTFLLIRDETYKRKTRAVVSTSICAIATTCALATISFTSHAAATPDVRTGAIINDFAHLVAAAVWVGGLASLAMAITEVFAYFEAEERRQTLLALVRRFSPIAAISVVVLVITGIYSAWAQVTVIEAMTTPYGITLAVKITLIVALLGVASANLVWVRPRLRGSGRAAQWLRILVIAEFTLASLVVLAVGYLTSLEPARQVASREGIGVEDQFRFQDEVEGTAIALEVEPGRIGPNTVSVSIEDRLGEPVTNATDVRIRTSYLEADLGETPLSATRTGPGAYTLEDQVVSIAGAWQIEVFVQRPNAFDARTAFRFEVVSSSGGSLAIAPDRDTGRTLLGVELGILGLLIMGVGIPLGGWFSRSGAAVMTPGLLGVLAGAVLLFQSFASDDGTSLRNPIPPTQESVATGRGLYDDNCLQCHGVSGRGDGPTGVSLDPPPADLGVHVPLHSDRALFDFIRDGIPDSAMVGVDDKLSTEEIWHVVNYIQTLEQQ